MTFRFYIDSAMVQTRLEINFTRLLAQCGKMASEGNEDDWRLKKYVESLEDRLTEIKKSPNPPAAETLADYSRKVDFLKGHIDIRTLPTPQEKVISCQNISHGVATGEQTVVKEIHHKATSKYGKELREELFQSKREDSNLRKRGGATEGSSTEDLDAILRFHHNQQEKIAEDMLSLARNMKEQAHVANTLIKKDQETLGKSVDLAEKNTGTLQLASDQLVEHKQKACKCWVWVMLVLICSVFIGMVMFMRLFSKRI